METEVREVPVKSEITVPDTVFENPVVQDLWARTVQHIAWGLIGLAVVTVLGVFLLAGAGRELPETVILLATTVATGCISGLVGFIAGKSQGA